MRTKPTSNGTETTMNRAEELTTDNLQELAADDLSGVAAGGSLEDAVKKVAEINCFAVVGGVGVSFISLL
jgi:hypothetical protein